MEVRIESFSANTSSNSHFSSNFSTFKVGNEYVRLSLLSRPSEFELLIEKLSRLIPLEWEFPVKLYDVDSLEDMLDFASTKTKQFLKPSLPPRYVIGSLEFPSISKSTTVHHLATFDLGNSQQTLLTVQDCLGCRSKLEPNTGCPYIVPLCESKKSNNETDAQFCWSTHPDQYVPDESFYYTNKNCSHTGGTYAGQFNNNSVCMQCFDESDHSRYTISAEAPELLLHGASVITDSQEYERAPPVKNFQFGALIRTVPHVNRIWSNVGIGAGSSFLNQVSAKSLLLDFHYYDRKIIQFRNDRIVFNPSLTMYKDWNFAPYAISDHKKRLHQIYYFKFGDKPHLNQDLYQGLVPSFTFHIDTGNNGISIKDKAILKNLARGSLGEWVSHSENINGTRILCTPWAQSNGPNLRISLSPGFEVTIPPRVWILDFKEREGTHVKLRRSLDDIGISYNVHETCMRDPIKPMNPTIFSTYHKNVLGLPFISAPGYSFVFDDIDKRMYIG